jgi:hypothetical protein
LHISYFGSGVNGFAEMEMIKGGLMKVIIYDDQGNPQAIVKLKPKKVYNFKVENNGKRYQVNVLAKEVNHGRD